jgi:hypothetical protein
MYSRSFISVEEIHKTLQPGADGSKQPDSVLINLTKMRLIYKLITEFHTFKARMLAN